MVRTWRPRESVVALNHPVHEVGLLVQVLGQDKEAGFRAFFPETLEVTKCHQDVLHGNGHGLLLKYVSTYAPKFSDS
ncbi:MAG: hypothetical protein NXI16_18495, partial [Alphaproteobacteria bacterium]|nr:hypothetical protein [Alphaproteobacteria bacterium]